jgi:hypothetical protein
MDYLTMNAMVQERMLSKKYPSCHLNEKALLELKEKLEDEGYFEAYQLIDPESEFANDIIYNYSAVHNQVEVLVSEDLILDCINNKLMTQGYDDLIETLTTVVNPIAELFESYSGMVRIIRVKDKIYADKVKFVTTDNNKTVEEDANREYAKLYKLFEEFANKLYQNAEQIKQSLK